MMKRARLLELSPDQRATFRRRVIDFNLPALDNSQAVLSPLSAERHQSSDHVSQFYFSRVKPQSVVTDRLRSYGAAMRISGNADQRVCGRWVNNRAENSHQPFRRRERAMLRFRSMKALQKFSAIHASVQNHFNQERHLVSREKYKQDRSAALAEWRMLAA